MAIAGAKSAKGKYGTFFNSFHPDVKQLTQKIEWITNKISTSKVSLLFNQTCLKRENAYIRGTFNKFPHFFCTSI